MRPLIEHLSAGTSLRAVGLIGMVALAACDNPSTAPPVANQTAKRAYDRSAYVETPTNAHNRSVTAMSSSRSANVISTPSSPNVIVNGSFEDGGGSLTGWTVFNQAGGSGDWFVQTGTASPRNGFAVAAPTAGVYAAMTDQPAEGTHILYQDVTVPAGASLSFDVFIANRVWPFRTPASLSFTVVPNQQARVDLMTTTAPISSVTTGVISNLYQTVADDPLVSGYTSQTTSLASLAGQTVRLRFSEVDNQSWFNMGIDNVSLRVTYAGLCSALEALVSKPGIRQSLCAKLTNAADEARGATTAQNATLAAFVHEVEAQTDKSITPANAALLISAAQSLMAP
jgi:hypothetical protein